MIFPDLCALYVRHCMQRGRENVGVHVWFCMCCVCIEASVQRDPSRPSIAIVLYISIGNSTVINPRDCHPMDVLRAMHWGVTEIQMQQADAKLEIHPQ